jgi:hypothetical protein
MPIPGAYARLVPLLRAIVEDMAPEDAPNAPAKPHCFFDAGWLGMRYAEVLPIPLAAKQKLLEIEDSIDRLEIIYRFLEGPRACCPRREALRGCAAPAPAVRHSPERPSADPLQARLHRHGARLDLHQQRRDAQAEVAEGVVKSRRWRYGDHAAGEALRRPFAGPRHRRQLRQRQQAAPDARRRAGFEQHALLVQQNQQRCLALRNGRLRGFRSGSSAVRPGGAGDAGRRKRTGIAARLGRGCRPWRRGPSVPGCRWRHRASASVRRPAPTVAFPPPPLPGKPSMPKARHSTRLTLPSMIGACAPKQKVAIELAVERPMPGSRR